MKSIHCYKKQQLYAMYDMHYKVSICWHGSIVDWGKRGKAWRIFTYPFSSPSSKFLDWEKGVVRENGGDWEVRDGIAWEGKGEAKVAARAKEMRLGRTLYPSARFGVWVWVFSLGKAREGRTLIRFMIYGVPFAPSLFLLLLLKQFTIICFISLWKFIL